VATFGDADPATRQRIAQLTQKTNQLNMTTRRYSEQDIQQMMDDPEWRVYWTRVEDCFGDNGIIGVMIAHEQGDGWLIDTVLMSCRVIGRTVETAMLGVLADKARQAGAKQLLGPFIPTAKNAPAEKIYADNDFRCIEEGDKESLWELNLTASKLAPPEWIECRFEESEVKS
jgi:FkbH-like protein